MRRLVTALVAGAMVAGWVSPASALTCSVTQIVAGLCAVGGGTSGTGVNVWVSGSTSGSTTTVPKPKPTVCPTVVAGRCVGTSPKKKVVAPQSVSDIASFRPRSASQFSEPSGWGIAHVPVNIVSVAGTHIVSGTLAGFAADVRFIPVRYRRTFGDGGSQSTASKGSRWTAPWAATPTSHTYAAAGTYRVHLVVDYVADYRYSGMAWTRLSGIVTGPAPDISVRIVAADTVLVARPCVSGAIGCG